MSRFAQCQCQPAEDRRYLPSPCLVCQHWEKYGTRLTIEQLEATGMRAQESSQIRKLKPYWQGYQSYTHAEVLALIRPWIVRQNRLPASADWAVHAPDRPEFSEKLMRRLFGSLTAFWAACVREQVATRAQELAALRAASLRSKRKRTPEEKAGMTQIFARKNTTTLGA